MREIKFRAWDKKLKEMIDEAMEIKNIGLGEGSVSVDEKTQSGNELIWLQYTGLKDKNGKEIFEGDILKNTLPSGSIDNKQVKWIKDWGKDDSDQPIFSIGFRLKHIGKIGEISYWWNEKTIEVIGNIYENPELLK